MNNAAIAKQAKADVGAARAVHGEMSECDLEIVEAEFADVDHTADERRVWRKVALKELGR